MKECKKGDVLVAESTLPQHNDYIMKVGAIITDYGSTLSHASMLARETNIPCIVDTKIATKVLKDGDMVEVDANKGIVRKIK
jgi:pyruvate,water dikinase